MFNIWFTDAKQRKRRDCVVKYGNVCNRYNVNSVKSVKKDLRGLSINISILTGLSYKLSQNICAMIGFHLISGVYGYRLGLKMG